MNNSKLVRGALLVALALALQSLRLVLPMPQPLSTFIIGTLVHMMLVLTLQVGGLKTAFCWRFAAADCLFAGAGAAAVSDSCNLAGQFYLCPACASV